MNEVFKKIIEDICYDLSINYKFLSKDWIIMLEKNENRKFISGFKFDLNSHALGNVLDDKYATYEVLKSIDVPVIEHNIVYSPSNKNNYAIDCNNFDYLEQLFYKYNKDVVLKINGGTCGAQVIHLTNKEDLRKQYEMLIKRYHSLSLCPFYNIENEYRAIVLNGKVELLYKKIRAVVIGNGKSTIKDLLQNFNPQYFKNYNEENSEFVLKDGEVYEYDWRYNLSNGAKVSFEILDEDRKNISELAEKISNKIGVNFGSIDIIKTIDKKLFTMEINSGVMTNNFIDQVEGGYEIAKNIYKKAIKALMDEE
ncbi:MAG: hypothetical protein IKG14_06455 [Clostridia bacterium]|nr:hypothetical protein [Clostridia bacterium]